MATKVYDKILLLDEGAEISISEIVHELYEEQGYKCIYLNPRYGWVWTKDDGATFSIEDDDQFEVLDIVEDKLKSQIILDFSKHDGLDERLPYNLSFIVRKTKI
ncbi:MAG: hypothetical protein NC205_04680 [Prevotella sp.]|nr:hypothetical protein [Alistipes senegalensis]MCM1357869.1 hypothetical protein [Prevotella sp.]MCM1473010.1 hypothetical protein [Muribaculaceae bacterium]